MNIQHAVPKDGLSPEPSAHPGGQLLQEIARLLEAPLAPAEFYAEFLQRVLAATGAVAGVLWSRTPQGTFEVQYQVNAAEVGLDQVPGARDCHAEVLRKAAQRDRPLWVPPRSGPGPSGGQPVAANLTAYGLLLAPVLVDRQVAGVLELWTEPHPEGPPGRGLARFVMEVAGFAAAYLHRGQWENLVEQQKLAAEHDAFAREVHGSLDPREVAYLVANQGRRLVECDQVAVGVRRGKAVRVEAVSGAPVVEKRSRLVQALGRLFEAVLAWGERLVYSGSRDEALPPAVAQALDAYLAESNSKLLVVVPLLDEREKADQRPGRCALLAESFEPDSISGRLEARLEGVVQHAAPALYNAVEYRRLPLRWLTGPLARFRDGLQGRGWVKLAVVLAALGLPAAALVLIPAPLRMDARGQLLPTDRQTVYATLTGKVVEMKAQHGDRVEKGQELLFLEDLESQLKIEQLGIKVRSAQQRLALLGEQIGKAATAEERTSLLHERIDQEYELRKALVEREILLQESRNPRKAPVRSPLAGKVVTFDPQEQLVGKTVKPGDPLLRIARVQGPWEVELHIPEGNVGPIREALLQSPRKALEVDLLLASEPNRTYHGWLQRDGLGGETVVKDNAVVLPARVRITDRELLGRLAAMPVGVEVRAKVHCGRRSVGYVWFYDLMEFFYEHVWF